MLGRDALSSSATKGAASALYPAVPLRLPGSRRATLYGRSFAPDLYLVL